MATKPTLPPSIWAENRPTLPPTTDSQWGQGFEYTSATSGGKALTETFDYPLFKIDESLRWLRDLFDDNGVISGLPDATTTQKGVVKKATTEDVQSGTDDEKYVTPAGIDGVFPNTLNTIGTQHIYGGLILNWGEAEDVTESDGSVTISFNESFPTQVLQAYATTINASTNNDDVFARVVSVTNSSITLRAEKVSDGSKSGTRNISFLVIGK